MRHGKGGCEGGAQMGLTDVSNALSRSKHATAY
jgi:hypothetical protein